ncbi:MAG: DUF1492 domain-containing protein [Peptococcaceae bacterium]|nr:DUF1492 domain-containing protein [Peptococcaceae bacterium]
MTAKEFLRGLRKTQAEIRALSEQVAMLRAEAQGVQAVTLRDMPKGGTARDAAAAIAEALDLQAACAAQMEDLMRRRQEAMAVITKIERSELRSVLLLYYLGGKSWDQVADALNYSVRQTLRLHGEALLAFEAGCH